MARLAWVASEVASATGFPNEIHDIAEGLNPTRVGSDAWTMRTLSRQTTLLLPPAGIVFTEMVRSRMVGYSELIVGRRG
jgi:hypothetical protein